MNVIRPGDTVIFSTPNAISEADADRVRAALKRELPGVSFVIVSGLTHVATYRPDIETTGLDTAEPEYIEGAQHG